MLAELSTQIKIPAILPSADFVPRATASVTPPESLTPKPAKEGIAEESPSGTPVTIKLGFTQREKAALLGNEPSTRRLVEVEKCSCFLPSHEVQLIDNLPPL